MLLIHLFSVETMRWLPKSKIKTLFFSPRDQVREERNEKPQLMTNLDFFISVCKEGWDKNQYLTKRLELKSLNTVMDGKFCCYALRIFSDKKAKQYFMKMHLSRATFDLKVVLETCIFTRTKICLYLLIWNSEKKEASRKYKNQGFPFWY